MNKQTLGIVAAMGIFGSSMNSVMAAENEEQQVNPLTEKGAVKIEWQKPDDYRDIEAVAGKQSRYEKSVFEKLTKQLSRDAAKVLKPNQKLTMVVTDLDLAGDVRPTFGASPNDIRIVKDIYPPRMTFSYKVLEGEQVIMAGNEKLSDLGFMSSIRSSSHSDSLRHEMKLLKDWLRKSVAPRL